jgi:Uma2 family endonuclease
MQPNSSLTVDESFPFGWRYVQRTMPDGSIDFDQIPLTLEDALHPQEGDVIPETTVHNRDRAYLTEVFESRPLSPPITYVTTDLLINWGVEGMRNTSPDVAVFVGLNQEPNRNEGVFHLKEYGGRCLLALEIVSTSTRVNDVVHKKSLYHQADVPFYILIDQEREGSSRRLRAYRWQPTGYEEASLDDQGRLLLPGLGTYLTVHNDRVLCQDADTGRELGNYARLVRDLEEMERRDQEREREMESTILRAREAELSARQAEKAREDAEAKALKEARAREDAERELQELREQLRQLRGDERS